MNPLRKNVFKNANHKRKIKPSDLREVLKLILNRQEDLRSTIIECHLCVSINKPATGLS